MEMNRNHSQHPGWYTIRFVAALGFIALVLKWTATNWSFDGEGKAALVSAVGLVIARIGEHFFFKRGE